MGVLPPMLSKKQHAKQRRYLAAYEKIEAEATPQERIDHRSVHLHRSVIDDRIEALLASDWQPEDDWSAAAQNDQRPGAA
jgi:hypothetical protein